MMDQELRAIAPFLRWDPAHAHAADFFEAAVPDQPCRQVESLVRLRALFVGENGRHLENPAPARDLLGRAADPLFCAEISEQVAARLKLRRDLLKTGLLRRSQRRTDRLGFGGSRSGLRFLLPAAAEDEKQRGEKDC